MNNYSEWKRAAGKDEKGIRHHLTTKAHQESVLAAEAFKSQMSGQLNQVEIVANKAREKQVKENEELLQDVASAVRF